MSRHPFRRQTHGIDVHRAIGALQNDKERECPPKTDKMPGGKNVLVQFEEQIAWVTLNRPEKRNCIEPGAQ